MAAEAQEFGQDASAHQLTPSAPDRRQSAHAMSQTMAVCDDTRKAGGNQVATHSEVSHADEVALMQDELSKARSAASDAAQQLEAQQAHLDFLERNSERNELLAQLHQHVMTTALHKQAETATEAEQFVVKQLQEEHCNEIAATRAQTAQLKEQWQNEVVTLRRSAQSREREHSNELQKLAGLWNTQCAAATQAQQRCAELKDRVTTIRGQLRAAEDAHHSAVAKMRRQHQVEQEELSARLAHAPSEADMVLLHQQLEVAQSQEQSNEISRELSQELSHVVALRAEVMQQMAVAAGHAQRHATAESEMEALRQQVRAAGEDRDAMMKARAAEVGPRCWHLDAGWPHTNLHLNPPVMVHSASAGQAGSHRGARPDLRARGSA